MPELAQRILAFLARPNYQPMKPRALARKLGLSAGEDQVFKRVLRELVAEGKVHFGKNHFIQPPRPPGTVAGTFRRLNSGAGIVRPDAEEQGSGAEIFIPADDVGDAATGDRVLVRIHRRRHGRRPRDDERGPAGEIVRVVERATRQFVGTYFERGGDSFVRVDGAVFNDPIYVGDPGAKGARPEDKVVFEMVRFPTLALRGEGVITEVLGPRGQPGVDVLSIIRAYELPDEFPEDALNEARTQAAAFDPTDFTNREDFTNDLVITIDPVDARDCDDAVSLSFDPRKKHWHLTVHVADVAHFVPAGGPLDKEARRRGTSVYLPGKVLPMFPEIISNHLASLQEGQVRYVQSVKMEFTAKGEPVHAEFVRGVIRVRKRFTYEQASAILTAIDVPMTPTVGQAAAVPEFPFLKGDLANQVVPLLERLRDFTLVRRARRFKHGALELNMPEVALEYNDLGEVAGAHFTAHDISHQLIEECMLAANEAVASHLERQGTIFLRRIHPAPEPVKLAAFLAFVRTLGYEVDTHRPTDRHQLQRVLAESAERPERHAVHYALLRSLKQATYSPNDEGHYALAADDYAHFTSPIRRYPDLSVHRQLAQWQRTGKAGGDMTELLALGEHCSFTERRAARAEQDLIKLKLLTYLEERIGMELEAIITGVEEYGFFAQARTLPVEGLVHVRSLMDDNYWYEESTHSLHGQRTRRRFRLGDVVRVQVARVDLIRRLLDFRVLSEPTSVPSEREPPALRLPPWLVKKKGRTPRRH